MSKRVINQIVARRMAMQDEEGGTLVEMATVFAFVYLPVFFGIVQLGIMLYTYNFVCLVSKQAARYASVRGDESCTISASFPNCNLSPTSTGNPLQAYVRGLGFAGVNTSNITVTATWWSANITNPGDGTYSYTDWNTQCTTTDLNGNVCNSPGDAVKVVVTYPYSLNIPFVPKMTVNLSSTAQMVVTL